MDNDTQKNWLNRNWKWLALVAVIGGIVACIGCVILFGATIFGALKSSEPYEMAMDRVQENETAVAALGAPIDAGFLVSGSIEISGPSGNADLSIPVSGPKGSGTLYVVAVKSAGQWELLRLELAVKDSGERINLLTQH
jgi:hypothetical protein